MLLSNRAKNFLTIIFFLVFSGACGWGRVVSTPDVLKTSEPENELPFPTKEPARYTAEIVITIGDEKRTIKVARDGLLRRYDYDPGEKGQLSVLRNQKDIRMLPNKKVFTESEDAVAPSAPVPDDPLTVNLLRRKDYTEFTESGTENNITRFDAKLENGGASRIVVFVDRSIGMPVRQEYYSTENGVEVLRYSMEIRDFSTDVDDGVFAVPQGYRKVSPAEFSELLQPS
jgi:outer membrane lipoprotein-sorting protein